jgi:Dimerisation domain
MSTSEHPQGVNPPSPQMALMHLFHGARITQLLYVAAKLGIADLLSDGAKRSEELAQTVGAHPHTLYRILRALASLGIFAEEPDQHFRLTPMADLLRTEAPASLRPFAVLSGEEWVWRAEGALLSSVRGPSCLQPGAWHGRLRLLCPACRRCGVLSGGDDESVGS